jgi:hypothetical protein
MAKAVRFAVFGAAAMIAAAVSGCSGGSDFTPGALMSGGRDVALEQEALQQFQQVQVCPQVQVRQGTQVVRRYAKGKEGDPLAVTYQGTLSRFARECTAAGDGGTSIRVGIYGRIIAGAAASADGSVSASLPVRVVLVKNGSEVLYSQLHDVPAAVAAGQGSASWVKVVDGLSIPYYSDGSSYVIFVGFDEGTGT